MNKEAAHSVVEEIKDYEQECKRYIDELISYSTSNENAESKDFGKFERGLFEHMLKMGKLLTQLYFEKKKEISVKK